MKKNDSEVQIAQETELQEQEARADTQAVKARKHGKYQQRKCTKCGLRFSSPAWQGSLLCDACWKESRNGRWVPGMKKASEPGR